MTRARDVATQGGLVLIAKQDVSTASSVTVNNCFSSTYRNYRFVFELTASSATSQVNLQLTSSGTPSTTGYYYGYIGIVFNGTVGAGANFFGGSTSGIGLTKYDTGYAIGATSLDIYSPFQSITTKFLGQTIFSASTYQSGGAYHESSVSYDGIRLLTGTGTFSGSFSIYGYKQN